MSLGHMNRGDVCCSGPFSLEGSKDPGIPLPQAGPEDVWMLDMPPSSTCVSPLVLGGTLLM